MSRETTKDGLVIKNPNAAWFRMVAELHGKNTRLKELNREMVEVLKHLKLLRLLKYKEFHIDDDVLSLLEGILAKAGGEGE